MAKPTGNKLSALGQRACGGTIQAQILDLMNEPQAKPSASILLITHDLGVVTEAADRVVVMYASPGNGRG